MSPKTDLGRRFIAFDDVLAAKGVPPCTQWWRTHIGAWLDRYEQHGVLEFWACVGRGAAKSTAMMKLALFFTVIVGDLFRVPVGEIHYAIVLSRMKEEAAKGIAIISRWLQLLAIPHRLAGDVIELDGMPRGLRVCAASVAAASGWRAFFVAKDERSKWKMSGIEEEDAAEVDTSAGSMTATHPNAPSMTVGSAWGKEGIFYETITAGPTESKHVVGPTPTWIAAPHITQADCHRKESDTRKFLREYASVFQHGAGGAFDADLVEQAFSAPVPAGLLPCERVLLLDPTAGGSDTYAWATAGWEATPDRSVYRLVFDHADGIERAAKSGVTSDHIVARVVSDARSHGAEVIHSDQFERFGLASAFARYGLAFVPHVWTAPLKERCVEHVRRWLSDGLLVLPTTHARMKHELLDFQERFAPSGALTFRGRQGGHDDFAMLVLLAALVDIENGLPGSPLLAANPQSPAPLEGGWVTTNSGIDGSTVGTIDSMIDGLSAGILT